MMSLCLPNISYSFAELSARPGVLHLPLLSQAEGAFLRFLDFPAWNLYMRHCVSPPKDSEKCQYKDRIKLSGLQERGL